MSSNSESVPVTQIVYLEVDPSKDLKDTNSEEGRIWYEILELSKNSPGFQEQYWGQGHELPEKIRLHIVRATLDMHHAFRASEEGARFARLLSKLIMAGTTPIIRHVLLQDTELLDRSRAREAPITGSAIYSNCDEVFSNLVWPLWTHIVRYAEGNQGVAGGLVLDHESGKKAFLVYVGWRTNNDDHQKFRKSPPCADRRTILKMGNDSQDEYYHVVFNID